MDQKPLGPEDGVTWDPKLGFIIENPSSKFDGMFKCETEVKTIFFSFRILCKYVWLFGQNAGLHIRQGKRDIFLIFP